ncbi:hypothetical protein [uncultured Tenacibaculum sp.]|uniref:hypothetical protein n=1 Tax=uncultured Tenacibaculum sp. TaxID=174713 RepID=UPI002638FF80|nr:hypothetical protein [uncultured Tenacibaculum sp.]
MRDFLKRIKLIDDLQTELEVEKTDFVHKLKQNVDEGSTGIFSDAFDIFSRSKNDYKGNVDLNSFKVKRRKKLFDTNINLAVASGTYNQKGNKLIIDTEINGFSPIFIPFFIFCLLFYPVFIIIFLFGENNDTATILFAIPFILLHATFMIGIPYFLMRRGVKRLKRELEREFFYLT